MTKLRSLASQETSLWGGVGAAVDPNDVSSPNQGHPPFRGFETCPGDKGREGKSQETNHNVWIDDISTVSLVIIQKYCK